MKRVVTNGTDMSICSEEHCFYQQGKDCSACKMMQVDVETERLVDETLHYVEAREIGQPECEVIAITLRNKLNHAIDTAYKTRQGQLWLGLQSIYHRLIMVTDI